MKRVVVLCLSLCGLWPVGAATDTGTTQRSDFKRLVQVPHPEFNPPTPAKVRLGKVLFFDPRLSGGNAFACASCHNPEFGWEDGLEKSIGETGALLARHTPTILNLAWGKRFGWDGRIPTLEGFVLGPIANQKEMNQDIDTLVTELMAVSGYRKLFAEAFPDQAPSVDHISLAIAAFERTVVSAETPFDRWVDGDEAAISGDAKSGFQLFVGKAGCAQCHSGWNFTDNGFHDIGLAGKDPGRGGLEDVDPKLRHAFKTPTLRQIGDRSPYMHDGSLSGLEAVIEHYDSKFLRRPTLAKEIKPLLLTAKEKFQLRVFLATLSATVAPMAPPILPD